MYLITAEALKHDDFLRICDMKSATIPATNLSEERVLHSTNYLISNWRALGYLGQPGPRRQDRLHLRMPATAWYPLPRRAASPSSAWCWGPNP